MRRLLPLFVTTVLVIGCGADDWSEPRPAPRAVGTLGPGFVDAPPAPEATITPRPGSWDDVHPSEGYRVVLLGASRAVTDWAERERVSLKTVTVERSDPIPGIVAAMKLEPDLIVAEGPELVEPLELVTASHLDQQFLLLGAALPEPTFNVTAAGSQGDDFGRAIRAGVAAVLHGLTGIVIRLD